jgi:large subunit ribosomal protein L3
MADKEEQEQAQAEEAEEVKAEKSKKAKEEEVEPPGLAEEAKTSETDETRKVRVGLIGKKLGMTQVFDDNGRVIPVTVIQAGPCVVVQKKTQEKEGYSSVQLGFVESGKLKVNKPTEGHFKKAGVPPTRLLKEFAFEESEEEPVNVGDQILVHNVFSPDDLVNVSGRSTGRGFQGVMKRHGHSGGKATHGSMFHRAPGSIGASAYPSRVLPGIKMPGRMGNQQMKIRNLRVVQVDKENHLLVVKGAVPGSTGGYVTITRA